VTEDDKSKRRTVARPFKAGDTITISDKSVSWDQIDRLRVEQIYSSVSKITEFENGLINTRLTWSLAITGSFIVAEVFLGTSVMGVLATQKAARLQALACYFMSIVSLCAAVICLNSLLSIWSASLQLKYAREFYEECKLNDACIFEEIFRLPRPFGSRRLHLMGDIQAKIIPAVLVIMWLVLCGAEILAGNSFGQGSHGRPSVLAPPSNMPFELLHKISVD